MPACIALDSYAGGMLACIARSMAASYSSDSRRIFGDAAGEPRLRRRMLLRGDRGLALPPVLSAARNSNVLSHTWRASRGMASAACDCEH